MLITIDNDGILNRNAKFEKQKINYLEFKQKSLTIAHDRNVHITDDSSEIRKSLWFHIAP